MSETQKQIIDRYVETVTGFTPTDRANRKLANELTRAGLALDSFGNALSEALEPVQHFLSGLDFRREKD